MTRSAMIGQRRRLGRLCHLRSRLAKDRPMIRMSGETASRMPPARCLRWRGDWALSSGRARSFRPGRSETLALLARSLGHGEAGLFPRCEAAVHLEDGFEPHLLGDVRREGGAPGAVAVEDEALARSEDVLVVGAVGIDPELEHAARAMEGAGDHAFPLQLPHVAQVHEGHVIAAVAGARFLETEGGDAGLRLVHKLPESLLELHDVLLFGWRSPHSTPGRRRPLGMTAWSFSVSSWTSALHPRKFWVAWERGTETTGDPVAPDWDFRGRRQRRSKRSSAVITSALAVGDAAADRLEGFKPIARSVLFLAANQQANAAEQGRAGRQKCERARLRHLDARSGVSASRIDEEHRERHQSDQQPIVLLHESLPLICDFWATGGTIRAPSAECVPIHTYGAVGEARARPCQARRHCLRADGRA